MGAAKRKRVAAVRAGETFAQSQRVERGARPPKEVPACGTPRAMGAEDSTTFWSQIGGRSRRQGTCERS